MISPDTILHERYRIIDQLGHGGMGAVYEAVDKNLKCLVAVKETFASTGDQRRAFRREAELLANLSHPTLPKVMDYFTAEQGEFLVMQFVPGLDLAEMLEQKKQPFEVEKVLGWAEQLLDALEELHSSNPPIIHRDLKPSNLKLTPQGRVMLLDFGLAKGVAGQMSAHSSAGKSLHGYTLHYAAIEQIRGMGTDARSDLYSLGATLWTLLTARVPPDAVTRVAEKDEGNPDPLRAPSEFNSLVPAAISVAIIQAMALSRNHRYSSASEMRQALHRPSYSEFETPTSPIADALPPIASTTPAQAPTIRIPETDPGGSSSPSTTSPVSDKDRRARPSRLLIFSVTAVLLVGISIAALTGSGWRPWSTSTSDEPPGGAAENLSPSSPIAPTGMSYIPGGTFKMGRDEKDADKAERPAHEVTVKPFFVDTHEVTNADYRNFVNATGHSVPGSWTGGTYRIGDERKPVTGVTWDDANEYARWAGKRLPTEEEWEFAARGTDGRRYPWGNEWKSGMANAGFDLEAAMRYKADVGSYKGQSPFGSLDMAGNVWEWTASDFRPYPGGELPSGLPTGDLKVIRGGSYESAKENATTTYRTGWPARGAPRYDQTGFRCAKNISQ